MTRAGREEGLWRKTESDTDFGRSIGVCSYAGSALGRRLALWKLRRGAERSRIDGQTKTCKGTLGPAGSRDVPNMCGTGGENECWVVKGVLEMRVIGGEGEPGE